MNKTIIAFLIGITGLTLMAADSYSFTYQAALRDEKGEVIKDGKGNPKQNLTVEVRLYNAATGGNPLWGHAYSVLTDAEGLFNVAISDSEGSQLDNAPATATLEKIFKQYAPGSIFIGLTVAGSAGEIVPRQCVYATPFAAVANDVRGVSGDLTIGGKLKLGSGTTYVEITKNGIEQKGGTTVAQSLAVETTASVAGALTAGGGVLTANGDGVTVKGHPLNVSGTQLKIDGSEVVPVPVGGIIMWNKSELPDKIHWAICNGNNGTPDLRDRFVVGAGSKYQLTNVGGADSVTLNVNQIPSHNHQFTLDAYDIDDGWKNQNNLFTPAQHNASYKHTRSTTSVGGGQSHENRPPYYALYYIMRIK